MMRSLDHESQFARAPLAAAVGLVVSMIGSGAVRGSDETDGVPREAIDRVALASAGQETSGLVERRRIAELEAALASVAAQRAGLQRGVSALRREIYDLLLANERRSAADAEQVESESRAEKLLSEAEAGRLEAVGKLEALRRENERLFEDAEVERSEFEQGISAFRSEIDQLLGANVRLESEAEVRAASDSEARRRIEWLEEAIASSEAERSRLEQTALELRGEMEQLRDLNEWLALVAAERAGPESMEPGRLQDLERAEPEPLEVAVSAELTESVEFTQSARGQVQPEAAPLAATSVLAREATAIVEAWARAWSEQRVEDYLSFYSSTFEPAAELSLGEWESQRKKRVSEPARIEVLVAMADLRTLDKDRVEVVFLQSYESDLMADLVVKTLLLVREDGNWKIDAERASSPWES